MFTAFKFLSQTCLPALPGMDQSKKCPEGEVDFSRPVLSAFMMVSSMSLALIFYFGYLRGKPGVHSVTRKQLIYTLLPSFLDLICASTLMAGSMKIPMSLVLTLKGIRVLFSAILVIIVFKRKQRMYNWAGVAIALLGVGLAVLSAILNDGAGSASTTILGIGLILLSEFFRSLMVVSQEYLIKVIGCDPSFMIGLQGIYGGILMVGFMILSWLAIPGSDLGGSFENMEVTFKLASQSPTIITVLCVLPIFVVLGFISSAMVTKHLSSVHNAMATVMMTATVWLIEIFIHYAVDPRRGNKWGQYSALQLVGFSFVVVALLVYDGTYIKLPGFDYTTESKLEVEARQEIKALQSADDIQSVEDEITVSSREQAPQ